MFHEDKFLALVKPRSPEAVERAEQRRKQREEWINEWINPDKID